MGARKRPDGADRSSRIASRKRRTRYGNSIRARRRRPRIEVRPGRNATIERSVRRRTPRRAKSGETITVGRSPARNSQPGGVPAERRGRGGRAPYSEVGGRPKSGSAFETEEQNGLTRYDVPHAREVAEVRAPLALLADPADAPIAPSRRADTRTLAVPFAHSISPADAPAASVSPMSAPRLLHEAVGGSRRDADPAASNRAPSERAAFEGGDAKPERMVRTSH